MSNNLQGPRIADNQTSGQGRTANEAFELHDSVITETVSIKVGDSNAASPTFGLIYGYFRFVIEEGDTSPDGPVTVTVNEYGVGRGLTFWRNLLGWPVTLKIDGQSDPAVEIPAFSTALVDCDGFNFRLAVRQPFFHTVAVSDETTPLTTGTAKVTFRMPCHAWITDVRASLNVEQSGGTELTVGINKNGTPALSVPLTIDNSQKTSVGATTPPFVYYNDFEDDAEITIDIDAVGSGSPAGLKVTLIGYVL